MLSANKLQKLRGAVFYPLHLCFIVSHFAICISLDTLDGLELDFGSGVRQGNQSVQSRIEETLAELEGIKRAWKERYNDASMISRLPAEVLSIVFQIYACSAQQEQGRRQQIEWTAVLQVCSHWRRVALESPSVWSHVTFAYVRWTEAMIERSKSAPLTVHVVVPRCGIQSRRLPPDIMCDMLRKLLHRIRGLSFTLLDDADNMHLNRFASFVGRLVESLDDDARAFQLADFTIHSVPRRSFGRFGALAESLPATILRLGTCRLRNLRLHGMSRPWESPSLVKGLSLTMLSISGIPIYGGRPTVSQVIRVLGKLPDLQSPMPRLYRFLLKSPR